MANTSDRDLMVFYSGERLSSKFPGYKQVLRTTAGRGKVREPGCTDGPKRYDNFRGDRAQAPGNGGDRNFCVNYRIPG